MMTKTYREIGAEMPDVEIMHTTQFIESLLKQGKLNFRKENKIVTFHDPCILSYDLAMSGVPREIITALGFESEGAGLLGRAHSLLRRGIRG